MRSGGGSEDNEGSAGAQRSELTADRVRSIEFSDKLRGYNPDEVDEFLEEVAAGVDALVARVHALQASTSPAAPAIAPPPRVNEGSDPAFDQATVARALILAQRTADLAISDAERSARELIEQAQARANTTVAEAETQAAAMTEDARSRSHAAARELETRQMSIEHDLAALREQAQREADTLLREAKTAAAALTAQARAAADDTIKDLARERASLEHEVTALRSRAAQHREKLREMLSDHLLTLDGWLSADDEPDPGPGASSEGRAPVADHVPPGVPRADLVIVEERAAADTKKSNGSSSPATGMAGSAG